jgi:hypothetical protein
MHFQPCGAAAVATHPMAGLSLPAGAHAHLATGVPPPADALGFPQSGLEAREAAAGQPVLALSSPDATVNGAGGFQALPAVLITDLVIAFLGSAGWSTIRNLATLYPGFCDAIRNAVNADPVFQCLGRLVPPMRAIALRDLLWAAPRIAGANKLTQLQVSQASYALHAPGWLPCVEQLVHHKIDGVMPEHAALLAVCERVIRRDKFTDREVTEIPDLASAIQVKTQQFKFLMDLVWLRQDEGLDAPHLDTNTRALRNDVLRDAFVRIANAFAAEEGWTVEGLAV